MADKTALTERAAVRAKQLLQSYREVNRSLNQFIREQTDGLGLTPVQILTIRALAETPGMSLSELSGQIQLGCSTTSGVVKRLAEAGIVERERLDEDQRTIAIRLTEKGQNIIRQSDDEEESRLAKAVSRFMQLSAEDVDTLLELNQKLLQVLGPESVRKHIN